MASFGLSISFSWFWGNDETGIGQECLGCGDFIYGTMYFPIFQIGSADQCNFTDGKAITLCPDCFQEISENDKA